MDFYDIDFSDFVLFAIVPLVIFVVLVVHEVGHYIAARVFGIPVRDVVIGAGREIWVRKDRSKTRWSIRLYPIWAHVHITSFNNRTLPMWKRFFTVLAGPALNLALPFCLLFAFYLLAGQPSTPAVLTGVEIGDAADRAGLKPGDEIIAVDGQSTHRYKDVVRLGYDHTREALYTVRRNGENIEFKIMPSFLQFKDVDGIQRSVPRLGVQWDHKPTALKHVHRVNGVDTKGDIDKARELIRHNLGRSAVLGLNSNDGKVHDYRVNLYAASNPDIKNPDHEDYELVYTGKTRDDFYYRAGFWGSLGDSLADGAEMIRKVAVMPFQLLPIDPELLAPESAVSGPETWLVNKIFSLVYITSLASILLAFINFLPLPRLDGGILILYSLEAITGKPLSRKKKALTLTLSFFVFYAAVVISNMDNVPGYIDSRLKKIQEFMDDTE